MLRAHDARGVLRKRMFSLQKNVGRALIGYLVEQTSPFLDHFFLFSVFPATQHTDPSSESSKSSVIYERTTMGAEVEIPSAER